MPIPPVDRARIVEALAQFDRDERAAAKWQGWESKKNYKYAIVEGGHLYPVKEIISTATGTPVSSFSGGAESNDYLKKYGFLVEPLDLPTEGEVQVALHDLLVMRAPKPIEPSEAYQILADRFLLPERLRTKLMDNSNENHWQNRVRFARRKLVDAGIIDPSEHGRWQLKLREHPVVWVEKSHVKGRADRMEGESALGRALWSPLRAQNDSDIYRNMRLVQPNDFVLHLTDNLAFTGTSIADDFARPDFIGIAGTAWAGLPCYRIKLRSFLPVDPPLTKEQLVSASDVRKRMIDIRSRYSNLFYDPDLDLHQGGYLTEAPAELVALIDGVYEANTGRHLLSILPKATEHRTIDMVQRTNVTERDVTRRVWLYAPGRRAMYWDEFREAHIAGIGWDKVGDLSSLADPEAVKARMDAVYQEPESVVNANQCFDFAHRMSPGDWIFVKRGRREIIGFGVVQSNYRFAAQREYFQHVRDVDWQKEGSWPTGQHRMLSMKTLTEITDDEALIDELEELIGLTEHTPRELLPITRAPAYTAEDFSAETAISQETIETWESRLRRKQHIILQGPPGTGKTFVAERLARLLIGNTFGFVETVQFHPSYSYEDFMHGIRPVVLDGQLSFQRTPGRFLQFCQKAGRVQDESPCVLIIDEINRGNLSRIFGELMYLLEYRDQAIPLAGEDRPFGIPRNVFVIGTMNTADRSIALVDHALRRRFSFFHLAPDYDVLRSQLQKNGVVADDLIRALQAVNFAIDDRNYEIGISFFLKDGSQLRSTLQDVWEGEIEPYLEEYFYDQPSKLEPLRWRTLSSGVLAAWATDQ